MLLFEIGILHCTCALPGCLEDLLGAALAHLAQARALGADRAGEAGGLPVGAGLEADAAVQVLEGDHLRIQNCLGHPTNLSTQALKLSSK